MLSLLWIACGLVGLWLGSKLALRGTLEVAERRNLSQGFLGVTVLAVGTDLPEVLVAVTGGLHQLAGAEASGVVVGNAVGSALTQGSLVLGLAGLFGHLHMSRHTLRRDGTVLLLATALLAFLATGSQVTRFEGGVLLAVYAIYAWTLRAEERSRPRAGVVPWRRLLRSLAAIGGGLAIVLGSAELVVESALHLSGTFGWNQTVIGLFLIGAGTSLPELALSLGAVVKGRAALAVGNVIGSNVFDLLVPVGLSAVLHPLGVERLTLVMDLPAVAVVSMLGLLFFARARGLQRGEALVLVGVFFAYSLTRIVLL